MSIGPIHIPASVAGTPLSQSKGTEVDRAREEVGARQRQVYHDSKAEAAGGVGEPDGEDHETAQRDGDGRRPWEDQPEPETASHTVQTRQSKDPSQQSGNLLDLTG